MKKLFILLKFLAIQSTFALDEYPPIEPNTFQINGNYSHIRPTGYYTSDRDKEDIPSGYDPSANIFLLQLKYGILPGLSIETRVLPFVIYKDNFGDERGFNQPSLGLKYISPELGIGGVFDLTLPIGSEDIVGDDPVIQVEVGGRLSRQSEKYSILAGASYHIIFENGDEFNPGNVIQLFAKPEIRANSEFGINLLADWLFKEKDKYTGNEFLEFESSTADRFTLSPGMYINLNPKTMVEFSLPFTVLGRNAGSSWSLGARIFINLPS